MSRKKRGNRSVGQHYNQAAYIGRFYSKEKIKPKYRELKVGCVKISDLLSKIKNNKTVDIVKICKDNIAAEKIFTGFFISKKIEEDNKFNIVEKDFFEKIVEISDSENIDKINILIEKNKIEFHNYVSLHQARSFIFFVNLLIFCDCGNYNKIYGWGYFDFLVKDSDCDQNIKILYNEAIEQKKIGIQSYVLKVKELFNYIYPLKYKYLTQKMNNCIWFVYPHRSENPIGQSFFFNFKDDYVKISGSIFNNLPRLFKESIQDLNICFFARNYVLVGFPNNLSSSLGYKNIPYQNLFSEKKWAAIIQFLFEYNLRFSHPYIILNNTETEDSLQKTIDESSDNFLDFFPYKNRFDRYDEIKKYLK